MITEHAKTFIREHEEEALALLKTLAQIPSPSNHEEKRMEFCRTWLEDMGAEGVYTDDALNVVYPWGVTGENPVTVFMAHTDVVFPDTDPLPWKEENGRLCCPGVGDDTANLVCLLMIAKYVTSAGIRPKDGSGILFVCNAGEEGLGNLKGSRKICADYGDRIRAFYSFDGRLDAVISRAVGSHRFLVTARTQGGHSYSNFGRKNAIETLASVIEDIYAIQVPEEGKTTYNVGTISGGTSVNTIAQEASMLCEFRSDTKTGLDYMEEQFRRIFDRPDLSVKLVGDRPCENLSPEAEAVRESMLREAEARMEAVTGQKTVRESGSTDCNIPLSLGIPAVCFGAYYGNGAHTREEYVEKDSLAMGYEVTLDTVLSHCL